MHLWGHGIGCDRWGAWRCAAATHPATSDVRDVDLGVAVELVRDRQTREAAPDTLNRVLDGAKERGMVVGHGGLFANAPRICPSLVVSEADVDAAVAILDEAAAAT